MCSNEETARVRRGSHMVLWLLAIAWITSAVAAAQGGITPIPRRTDLRGDPHNRLTQKPPPP